MELPRPPHRGDPVVVAHQRPTHPAGRPPPGPTPHTIRSLPPDTAIGRPPSAPTATALTVPLWPSNGSYSSPLESRSHTRTVASWLPETTIGRGGRRAHRHRGAPVVMSAKVAGPGTATRCPARHPPCASLGSHPEPATVSARTGAGARGHSRHGKPSASRGHEARASSRGPRGRRRPGHAVFMQHPGTGHRTGTRTSPAGPARQLGCCHPNLLGRGGRIGCAAAEVLSSG